MTDSGDSESAIKVRVSILRRLKQAKFTHLLMALSLLLLVSPFIGVFSSELGKQLASMIVVGLYGIVLIAAALAVSNNKRHNRTTIAFAITCGILTLIGQLVDAQPLRIVQAICAIGFLLHVTRLLVHDLFHRTSVDYDTIAASLCGYLLIGVAFAITYSLATEINADSFTVNESLAQYGDRLSFGDHHTATSLYFSFVTLTTLGYGDISPVSMPARMLAMSEAFLGQVYLVVLVARLVGLQISNQSTIESQARR